MSGNNKAKYLEQLAKKVLTGKASGEEKLFLEEYYNAFEKHIDAHSELSEAEIVLLQQSIRKNIQSRLAHHSVPVRRSIFSQWRWAAAAVVLVSITAVLFVNKQNTNTDTAQTHAKPADILPGGNKATLILDDGSVILLDEAKTGTLAQQGGIAVNKTGDGKLIYSVATQNQAELRVSYNTITTPKGGQYQVLLPDGTKVWLNAASSIYFPTSFKEKQRTVSITGEVYFEVAHNAQQPFVVAAGKTRVEVLGTHFNIMAYGNEDVAKTTLIEGSVKVTDEGRIAKLHPGEQLQLNEKEFKVVRQADIEAELAWKNGLFFFKDAGIETVMKQAERWYNITVKYEGKIPEKQFNGKIPRNVNLSELMEILSFYDDMKCTIDGNTVTIKK
ncbi:FecR family protein [Agriterribacter sp.]|uniref:FecR family protein n=1 Tax=Agriterribacter sp. TaxID=2821509 RepID=UPI002C043442|nr:FecR domain-containing protein [Agriterribacter sp.]HTN08316.1 FecR domain-containing protein [Agriterribacter sp.]